MFEGRIRQIAVSNTVMKVNKFLTILNYGNFGLSYALTAANFLVCGPLRWHSGGSNVAQFAGFNDTQKAMILQAVDNAIVQKGNDIMANAASIQEALYPNVQNAVWNVIIADPTARFGFNVCMAITLQLFSFKAYKDFKWNYFGSLHGY